MGGGKVEEGTACHHASTQHLLIGTPTKTNDMHPKTTQHKIPKDNKKND
jgi:hypothetical protein